MKIGVFLGRLGNPAIYYPKFSQVTGGATASILLYQVLQWQGQLENPNEWVKVTFQEIETNTGLNLSEQQLARHLLGKRGLLKERSFNSNEETLELWVDLDRLENQLELLDKTAENPVDYSAKIQPKNSDLSSEAALLSPTSQTLKTDKYFGNSRPSLAIPVSPHYRFSGPWQSEQQFEEFQRSLLDYFKNLGYSNPGGCAFKIIDSMSKGMISPLWDDFISGRPLGDSQKREKWEWEIDSGVPYPAFEEERIQYYIHKGEPLEQAVLKARSDLRNPVLGKDLWEGFLRKCDRLADEAIQAQNHGVQTPYLPSSFTERREVTKASVMQKLMRISPQFSLESAQSSPLPAGEFETSEKISSEAEPTNSHQAPSLETLQKLYNTPMGKQLVEKQIAEHPEWGYEIVEGQVEAMPF